MEWIGRNGFKLNVLMLQCMLGVMGDLFCLYYAGTQYALQHKTHDCPHC